MATHATPVTAREYQRVSFDASGRERSPEEQHRDNARAADRRGWTLGQAYRDIGSASRYGRKVREDYARLVDDLEHDRFGASVLILWESSRGSRRLSEWVRLIELCEERGVQIYVTSDDKIYDAGDPRDRYTLQQDGARNEYASAETSKRVKRAHAANAADGRPNGPAPFGYRSVYDPTTGRLAGREIDPAEAAIVREIYQRLASGHSLRSIALDFERRGVVKRTGKPWPANHLRTMVLRPVYIGQRVHDPARNGQNAPTATATTTPGIWAPIVDPTLWQAVRRLLTDPARTTTRPGRAVHWLSGVARCDVCDGPMQARMRRDLAEEVAIYACHKRTCVRVPYDELNRFAEAVLLAYLERDDIAQALTATADDPVALAKAETELAAVERDIDDLADRASAGGEVARRLYDRNLPKLEKRLAAAKARRDELTAPSRLRGLIDPGKGVRRRYKATTLEVRREIARIVFVPDLAGELRVLRGPLRAPITTRAVWKQD